MLHRRLGSVLHECSFLLSAAVSVDFESEARERAVVTVTPGPRTTVSAVEIGFSGDLGGEGVARGA